MENMMCKNIVFRVDSSETIGSGHLMRCLTLAEHLVSKARVTFIVRNLSGNFNDLIIQHGFPYVLLPSIVSNESLDGYEVKLTVKQIVDAEQTKSILLSFGEIDCIIIDNYAIDIVWETQIRPYVNKIMVIDDLANRKHDCDILFDQNYEAENYNKYGGMIPEYCKKFLGLEYLLLRNEFYKIPKKILKGKVRKVLCFFGGSDTFNQTEKFLQVISCLNYMDLQFNIVVGAGNKRKREIREKCDILLNVQYHCQISYMADLMKEADLYIGSCGSAIWECYFLHIPSIVVTTTENERAYILDLKGEPPFFYIGWHMDITINFWVEYISDFIDNYVEKCDEIIFKKIANKEKLQELVSVL